MDLQHAKSKSSSKSRKTAAAAGGGSQTPGLTQLAHTQQKGKGGCPYLQRGGGDPDGQEAFERFKEAVLAAPMDVEDLGRIGRDQQVGVDSGACTRWHTGCA